MEHGPPPVALLGPACASVINQNPSHLPPRHPEKMDAILPFDFRGVEQSQIYLIHKRCRLQCMIGTFLSQIILSQATQLLIDYAENLVPSRLIAMSPLNE